MKKLSFILCLALLLPVFCIFASASGYGAPTQKLIITHVNVNYAGYEGTGVIYTKSDDGTIAQYGSFDWWNAVSFQWSSANKCFEVIEVKTEMGSSKGDMQIPENGFVYCCNVGNDLLFTKATPPLMPLMRMQTLIPIIQPLPFPIPAAMQRLSNLATRFIFTAPIFLTPPSAPTERFGIRKISKAMHSLR